MAKNAIGGETLRVTVHLRQRQRPQGPDHGEAQSCRGGGRALGAAGGGRRPFASGAGGFRGPAPPPPLRREDGEVKGGGWLLPQAPRYPEEKFVRPALVF